MILPNDTWLVVRLLKEGGTLKRIILSVTLVATIAAMIGVNTLSVTAQDYGQSDPATAASPSGEICAPWSKAYDLQKGQWVYQWYRWCVGPSRYDPSVESSWYAEEGGTQRRDRASLCPETGKRTTSSGGGMKMPMP